MSAIDVVIASVLGIAGAALLLFLLSALLSPIAASLKGSRNALRFKRSLIHLARADQLIEQEKYEAALDELRQSVILEPVRNRELLSKLRSHQQSILSRATVIAEETGGRTTGLGEVEDLFIQRLELLSLWIGVHEKFSKVSQRRESLGKALPAWSRSEYESRLGEVSSELSSNEKVLLRALDRLFTAIKSPQTEGITYH